MAKAYSPLLGVSLLAAVAFVPATLSAQSGVRSSTVPSYHLMQVSVEAGDIALDEFKAKAKAIRSCGEAGELAKALDADVKRDRFVRATDMPVSLQDELRELPTGHATKVFGDSQTLRVLVICNRL